ncbi:guanylyl cyclase 1-like isoform X3 [Phragmites australis]|uniref:guanylyl cyclase 1-like isoform X3 n=1 Tax=Phragmites australis TaxID=29695 RepID=UPI002D771A3D|nr:guanylyl cyclase 1-like isoform X3 [Phragmites australis]
MWPLRVISERLFNMAGDNGGQGPDSPSSDGQIPLARRSYYIDVPHVQQAFTWDCGLACVLMVLRTLGIDCCDGIADLEKLCRTTRNNCKKTLIEWMSYLEKHLMQELVFRSISAYDIAFLLLYGHCIAIALVDKTKLNSSWMNDVHDVQQLNEESDYMGHYVIICGYDADACEFEIRDPASSRKRERVTMKSLDEARKSFGTDEDILLVSLTGKSGMKLSRNLLAGSM